MKLSDIRGERVFDVIADIIAPISNIAEDQEAAALFKREKLPEGMTASKFMLQKAKKSAPVLLRNHKKDLIAILASIEGVSAADYTGKLTMAKLLADVVGLLADDAFTDLFTSAQTQTGETPSGSVRENTEDRCE